MSRSRRALALPLALIGTLGAPGLVLGHAIDDTFRLPVPLALYLAAAAVAVAASFVVSVVIVRPATANPSYQRRVVPALPARALSVLLAGRRLPFIGEGEGIQRAPGWD